MLSKILIIVITVSNLAFTPIKRGEPSPVDGVVMDEREARAVNEDLIKKDFLEKEVEERKRLEEAYRERVTITENQIGHYKGANEVLTSQVKRSKYETYLWFALGAVLTATSIKIGQKFAD